MAVRDRINGASAMQFAAIPGSDGKSAYQSYLDTTDDDPPLSEEEWSAAGSGTVGAIDGGAPDSIYEATVISGGEP